MRGFGDNFVTKLAENERYDGIKKNEHFLSISCSAIFKKEELDTTVLADFGCVFER